MQPFYPGRPRQSYGHQPGVMSDQHVNMGASLNTPHQDFAPRSIAPQGAHQAYSPQSSVRDQLQRQFEQGQYLRRFATQPGVMSNHPVNLATPVQQHQPMVGQYSVPPEPIGQPNQPVPQPGDHLYGLSEPTQHRQAPQQNYVTRPLTPPTGLTPRQPTQNSVIDQMKNLYGPPQLLGNSNEAARVAPARVVPGTAFPTVGGFNEIPGLHPQRAYEGNPNMHALPNQIGGPPSPPIPLNRFNQGDLTGPVYTPAQNTGLASSQFPNNQLPAPQSVSPGHYGQPLMNQDLPPSPAPYAGKTPDVVPELRNSSGATPGGYEYYGGRFDGPLAPHVNTPYNQWPAEAREQLFQGTSPEHQLAIRNIRGQHDAAQRLADQNMRTYASMGQPPGTQNFQAAVQTQGLLDQHRAQQDRNNMTPEQRQYVDIIGANNQATEPARQWPPKPLEGPRGTPYLPHGDDTSFSNSRFAVGRPGTHGSMVLPTATGGLALVNPNTYAAAVNQDNDPMSRVTNGPIQMSAPQMIAAAQNLSRERENAFYNQRAADVRSQRGISGATPQIASTNAGMAAAKADAKHTKEVMALRSFMAQRARNPRAIPSQLAQAAIARMRQQQMASQGMASVPTPQAQGNQIVTGMPNPNGPVIPQAVMPHDTPNIQDPKDISKRKYPVTRLAPSYANPPAYGMQY